MTKGVLASLVDGRPAFVASLGDRHLRDRVFAFPLDPEGEGVAGQATNEGVFFLLSFHPHPSCVRMPPSPVQGEGKE